jgi:hypothetical protein
MSESVLLKTAPGCDNKMDYERLADPEKKDETKNKIIDTCAPYSLFKNYFYNSETNKLEKT